MRFEVRRVRDARFPRRHANDVGYDLLAHATDAPARAAALAGAVRMRIGRPPGERVEVREVPDAELVHVASPRAWAYWSDGVLSLAEDLVACAPPLRGLTEDAVELIERVLQSESGDPAVGWGALARVAAVQGRTRLGGVAGLAVVDPPQGVACAEALVVRTREGTERTLYTWHAAFEGESLFVVCATPADLRAAIEAEMESLAAAR